MGTFGKIRARFGLLVIKDQFFIRISLSFGAPGLSVVTNGRMFLDGFGLYFKALSHDEKSTSACILFTSFRG